LGTAVASTPETDADAACDDDGDCDNDAGGGGTTGIVEQ